MSGPDWIARIAGRLAAVDAVDARFDASGGRPVRLSGSLGARYAALSRRRTEWAEDRRALARFRARAGRPSFEAEFRALDETTAAAVEALRDLARVAADRGASRRDRRAAARRWLTALERETSALEGISGDA